MLSAIVRACKLKNDVLTPRLPIQFALFEMILFEVERHFAMQPYLSCLYKAIFALAYYGMLRIGEMAKSKHVIKACDVHIACNKNKILVILYSSKTHDVGLLPQKIKITENEEFKAKCDRNFCPFRLLRNFIKIRRNYIDNSEQFFVYSDWSPVLSQSV